MICNSAIRNLIREDKVAQMYSAIQTGQAQGMITLAQCLTQLVSENLIAKETARDVAINKTLF
jgi:twitching motility protein PilT